MKQIRLVSKCFQWMLIIMTCLIMMTQARAGNAESDNAIANVLLDEHFVTATGSTPPAGWRSFAAVGGTQDIWRFDNPRARTLTSPIAAPAACVDFDSIKNRDVILESPAFDASSSSQLVFSFDYSFAATDSLVSGKAEVFNGFSWQEVFSVQTSSAAAVRANIDVTSQTMCATQARVRFRWIGQRRGYFFVDNVTVVRRPITIPPSPVITVSPSNGALDISSRSALAWTPSAPCPTGYKIYVGTNNPPTNIWNGLDVGNTTASNQLRYSYNTTYYWKVVPYNLNGDAPGCPVYTFRTGADPTISTYPYNQTFDGSTYGWESENQNGDAFTWELTTSNPRSAPYAAIAYANTNGSTPGNDWLYTPPLRMAAGRQYKIDFWTRATNAAKPEALEVKWGADQTSAMMYLVPSWRDAAITSTTYQMSSALITAPDSVGTSNMYIGWHFISAAGSESLLLDDVSISDNGSAPVILSSFTPTRLNPTSVKLAWRVFSQTNNLQFEVQKATAPSLNYQTIAGSVVSGNGTTTTPYNYSWTDNNVGAGMTYYRLKQTSTNSSVYYSNPVKIDGVTSVATGDNAPKEFSLSQNYPNPFNPETKIQFSVSKSDYTQLNVYNVLGQVVATLFDGQAVSGTMYTATFDAKHLTSGVYFYRLESGNLHEVKKLVLLK